MPQQVWLITGTSSGFGAEFVKDLLSCGDKVVATARNLSIIPHLKNRGAVITLLDIPAPQVELEAKTHEAIAIYGHVNVLVNNAGYAHFGVFEDSKYKDWLAQFNINLFGISMQHG